MSSSQLQTPHLSWFPEESRNLGLTNSILPLYFPNPTKEYMCGGGGGICSTWKSTHVLHVFFIHHRCFHFLPRSLYLPTFSTPHRTYRMKISWSKILDPILEPFDCGIWAQIFSLGFSLSLTKQRNSLVECLQQLETNHGCHDWAFEDIHHLNLPNPNQPSQHLVKVLDRSLIKNRSTQRTVRQAVEFLGYMPT